MRPPGRKKWSVHEHRLYLDLVWRKHPLLWPDIARRIGSRTAEKCRRHDQHICNKVLRALCATHYDSAARKTLKLPSLEAIAARFRVDELSGKIPEARQRELFGALPAVSKATEVTRQLEEDERSTLRNVSVSSPLLGPVDVECATSTMPSRGDEIGPLPTIDELMAIPDDAEPSSFPWDTLGSLNCGMLAPNVTAEVSHLDEEFFRQSEIESSHGVDPLWDFWPTSTTEEDERSTLRNVPVSSPLLGPVDVECATSTMPSRGDEIGPLPTIDELMAIPDDAEPSPFPWDTPGSLNCGMLAPNEVSHLDEEFFRQSEIESSHSVDPLGLMADIDILDDVELFLSD